MGIGIYFNPPQNP